MNKKNNPSSWSTCVNYFVIRSTKFKWKVLMLKIFCNDFPRGANMMIWTKFGINYSFIFEFDNRHHFLYWHMFEAASIFTIVWSGSFFLYLACSVSDMLVGFQWLGKIPWQFHPLFYIRMEVRFEWCGRYSFAKGNRISSTAFDSGLPILSDRPSGYCISCSMVSNQKQLVARENSGSHLVRAVCDHSISRLFLGWSIGESRHCSLWSGIHLLLLHVRCVGWNQYVKFQWIF